jgi:hypothetical protein
MKKNSLSEKGLSLSQAQSISNICNQRAMEIENSINIINNYSKTIHIDDGSGKIRSFVQTKGNKIPKDIVVLKTKQELSF